MKLDEADGVLVLAHGLQSSEASKENGFPTAIGTGHSCYFSLSLVAKKEIKLLFVNYNYNNTITSTTPTPSQLIPPQSKSRQLKHSSNTPASHPLPVS